MTDVAQNRIPATVKGALTLLFIAAGIYYVWLRKEEFLALEWPSVAAILVVSAAFLTNVLIMALFNALVSRRLGANITVVESLALSIVTSAANFVLPMRPGTGLRGIYMKRVYQLSYSRFGSTLVVFYLCNILVASLLGTAALAAIYVDSGLLAMDLLLAFPIMLVASGAAIAFRRGAIDGSDDHLPWWSRMRIGFHEIVGQSSVIVPALVLVLVSFVVSTLSWHFALGEYIAAITYPDSFLIVASQVLGGLVPITAGGTGIQELAGIYVGHRLDMIIVNLFAVLIWTKVLRIGISVIAAIPAGWYLNRRMRAL